MTIFFSAVIFLASALGRVWGFLGDLLLIFFFAWLVGSLLIHVVNSLMRIPHMRRPLAILLVYLGLITLILNFAFLVIPNTVNQIEGLADEIPSLVETIPALAQTVDNLLEDIGLRAGLVERVEEQPLQDIFEEAGAWLTTNAVPILQNIASALFSITLVIAISFYIVLDGGRRLHEALKVLPPRAERETRFVLTTSSRSTCGFNRSSRTRSRARRTSSPATSISSRRVSDSSSRRSMLMAVSVGSPSVSLSRSRLFSRLLQELIRLRRPESMFCSIWSTWNRGCALFTPDRTSASAWSSARTTPK